MYRLVLLALSLVVGVCTLHMDSRFVDTILKTYETLFNTKDSRGLGKLFVPEPRVTLMRNDPASTAYDEHAKFIKTAKGMEKFFADMFKNGAKDLKFNSVRVPYNESIIGNFTFSCHDGPADGLIRIELNDDKLVYEMLAQTNSALAHRLFK